MKALLTAIKTQLEAYLIYVRESDIFITEDERVIPEATKFPAVGLKDGEITYDIEYQGAKESSELFVKAIAYVQLEKPEASIMGDTSTGKKGVLDIIADIKFNLRIDILKILDDCGDTSNIEDWVEEADALNPIDNQVYVKQGSHSMALGIDADLDAADSARWSKIQDEGDLSAYQHDWIYIWIYIPILDYLLPVGDTFVYYIGTDTSNFIEFRLEKSNFSVGWNLIKCDLDNPDAITGTINWATIGWQRFLVFESVGNTNDFTLYIDSIMLVRPFSGDIQANEVWFVSESESELLADEELAIQMKILTMRYVRYGTY